MSQPDNEAPIRGFYRTRRRQQVLETYVEAAQNGEPAPSLASIARRCGLYDFRDARRVRNDLRRMGRLG